MTILTWLVACAPVPADPVVPAVEDDAPPEVGPIPWLGSHAPDTVPAATGDTGSAGVDVGLFGTCEPVPTDPPLIPGARLVGTYAPPSGDATFASQVFTDLDSYAGFLADLGIVGSFIDFGVEHAAVFGYGGETSCGFQLDGWDAVDLGGTPAVVVRVDDSSWGCDLDCTGAPSAVWVFAFPSAATPLTCLRVGGGCGPHP